MERQNLSLFKKQVLFIVVSLVYYPHSIIAKQPLKSKMVFEILNYKKNYHIGDRLNIYIKNISNEPLYFVITKQGWTGDKWFTSILDINHPLSDTQIFILLKPHQSKTINIDLRKIVISPNPKIKMHDSVGPSRLNMKFAEKIGLNEQTIASKAFVIES